MRVGILSDTHDQIERAAAAVDLLVSEGADVLVHCGDLTGTEMVEACARLPVYYVFGNNDFDEDALRTAIQKNKGVCLEKTGEFVLEGRRIAVTHGDSRRQLRALEVSQPDYVLFGHTHQPSDERIGRTRWINPGALHRARSWTVAVLDLERDALRFLNVERGG